MNEELQNIISDIPDVPTPKTQSPEYKLVKFLSTLFIVAMLIVAGVGLVIVRELRTMSMDKIEAEKQLKRDTNSIQSGTEDLKNIAADIDVLKHKMESVESRVHLLYIPSGGINTSLQGGNVQIGPQQSRKEELRKKPKLKTSELAELLGVTNETVTGKIKRDENGDPLCYVYAGVICKVERMGNTFLIENPFYE